MQHTYCFASGVWRSGSATDFDSVVIGSIPITLVWDVYQKIPYIYFSFIKNMPYIAVKCCVGISHRTDGMSGIPIFTPLIVRLHTALKCMQTRLHGVTESTQCAHLEEQVQVLLQPLDFS